jgi:hypothetical protein
MEVSAHFVTVQLIQIEVMPHKIKRNENNGQDFSVRDNSFL